MTTFRIARIWGPAGLCLALAACGAGNPLGGFGDPTGQNRQIFRDTARIDAQPVAMRAPERSSTLWDIFSDRDDPNTTVEVNKYLWQASLEVLDFLPIQTVDPFTGVIVTGYGTPPGGGQSYRATVYVQDPALDARSLKVALDTRGGAVSSETTRAVEDAILTRARQLRIRDSKL